MPGDTLYVRNLQIESNTSASGNGFSSTGYGNLSYDGTEILGTGGVGHWTKDGTSIYYDGGNVGIQNTNPQHALSIGSPSNVYVDTSTRSLVFSDNFHRIRTNTGRLNFSAHEHKFYYRSSGGAELGPDPIVSFGAVGASTNVHIYNDLIVDGTISGSASASDLTTGTLPIARIANGSVTDAKLASGIDAGKITQGTLPNGRLGSDYTNVGSLTLASNKNLTMQSSGSLVFGDSPIIDTESLYSNPNTVIKKDLIRFNDGRTTTTYEILGVPFTLTNSYSKGIVNTANSLTLTTSNTFYFKTNGFLPDPGDEPTEFYSMKISPSQIVVPSGQLLVGHSSTVNNQTGAIDIKTNDSDFPDTHSNATVTYKILHPALMLRTSNVGSDGLRWAIGINTHGTVPIFSGHASTHETSNCLYFVSGGNPYQNQDITGADARTFSQGGFIRLFANSSYDAYTNNQMNFTGQHRCKSENINLYSNTYIGYIVGSNGSYSMIGSTVKTTSNNIHINECLPYVSLTDTEKQSSVFGVISNIEDKNSGSRQMTHGVWGSVIPKPKGDSRVIVNSIGEGAIWVSNVNGPLTNGDYITTSSIPGLGMKQDENQLMNYTVAKITMDCDFNPIEEPIMVARTQTVEVKREKYETNTYTVTETRTVFDPDTGHWVQKEETVTKSESEQVFEEVDLYNEQGEIIGKHTVPVYETTTQEQKVVDENGQLVFDDSGQTQPAYLVKYVSSDGTILDSEQPGCYKMAFVGCTYHCG